MGYITKLLWAQFFSKDYLMEGECADFFHFLTEKKVHVTLPAQGGAGG